MEIELHPIFLSLTEQGVTSRSGSQLLPNIAKFFGATGKEHPELSHWDRQKRIRQA